jgi:fructokinase
MVLAVCTETAEILERTSIPTTTPAETIPQMVDWFAKRDVEAVGIGFFGPIQLDRSAPDYGNVTRTPKLAWTNAPVVKPFQEALGVPIAFDTDVNAAALGEAAFGAARGTENSVYITIGTGIGMGVISNGEVVHGMMHPEGGHILIRRNPKDTYKGRCPFHGDRCLEGMACGPAIEERWGKKAYDLTDNPDVWEIEADYIAQGIVDMIYILSPEKFVLGGGVMHQEQLMPLVRARVLELLNGYPQTPQLADIDHYIVRPELNDNQALIGCVQMALSEMKR